MAVSVIVCCRTRLFAEGIQQLLDDAGETKNLGIACQDSEIKNLMQYDPDVIITDMGSCRNILSMLPPGADKNVLLVNDAGDLSSESLKGLIALGLGGVLPRDADGKLLKKATKKLAEGELWIDHQTIRDVLSVKEDVKPNIHLTKKEAEILDYICSGLTNKEIARKLYISEQTVKSHCNHLFKKFGVTSRLKLALRAPQCRPGAAKDARLMQ